MSPQRFAVWTFRQNLSHLVVTTATLRRRLISPAALATSLLLARRHRKRAIASSLQIFRRRSKMNTQTEGAVSHIYKNRDETTSVLPPLALRHDLFLSAFDIEMIQMPPQH